MADKFVFPIERSPELSPDFKGRPTEKVKPGMLADYAKQSPELARPRMKMPKSTEGWVFDPSSSPELGYSKEDDFAYRRSLDIAGEADDTRFRDAAEEASARNGMPEKPAEGGNNE